MRHWFKYLFVGNQGKSQNDKLSSSKCCNAHIALFLTYFNPNSTYPSFHSLSPDVTVRANVVPSKYLEIGFILT
jgi:hypothetical protein